MYEMCGDENCLQYNSTYRSLMSEGLRLVRTESVLDL